MRIFGLLLTVVCALLVSSCASSIGRGPVPTIIDARLNNEGNKSRFVLDILGYSEYRVFTLRDPNRIVIDLTGTRWSGPRSGHSGAGLISQYRTGQPDPEIYRVVLDLNSPAVVDTVFNLPGRRPGETRLVVDLAKANTIRMAQQQDEDIAGEVGVPDPVVIASRKPSSGRPIIVIDPGHGGKDPGAIGRMGTREKDVVLAVARMMRDELRETGRYDVRMTRDRDVFVELPDRARYGERARASVFISLHADSNRNTALKGAHLYVHARASQQSQAYGRHLLAQLGRSTELIDNPIRRANFAVLRGRGVPSVLVEIGFLSTRSDESRLTKTSYQKTLAKAMARATMDYLK